MRACCGVERRESSVQSSASIAVSDTPDTLAGSRFTETCDPNSPQQVTAAATQDRSPNGHSEGIGVHIDIARDTTAALFHICIGCKARNP